MARKQSKVERFTQECITASPEELDLMLDIIKGIRGKRQPPKPRAAAKPKAAPRSTNEADTRSLQPA